MSPKIIKETIIFIGIFVLILFFSKNISYANQELPLSDKQQAVLAVAYAFLDRGDFLQYDSTGLCHYISNYGNTTSFNSRQTRHLSPEMATSQDNYYTVCSGFTYSVYEEALGIQIPEVTRTLMEEAQANQENKDYIPVYEEVSDTTTLDQFKAALEPGDVIVYRDINQNGHAMLYMGNNIYTESWGSKYNFQTQKDMVEDNGTIRTNQIANLVDPEASYYLLRKNASEQYIIESFAILRPLATEAGKKAEITESAKTRLQYPNLYTEQLGIHNNTYSVQLGEELTYTIQITNQGESTYQNLPISTTIPEYTTLLPSAISHHGTSEGRTIQWNIPLIKPKQTIYLSYTVKASEESENQGKEISTSDTFIGNIKLNEITNYLGNPFSTKEEEAFKETFYRYVLQNQKGYLNYVSDSAQMQNQELNPEQANAKQPISLTQKDFLNVLYEQTFGTSIYSLEFENWQERLFESIGNYGRDTLYQLKEENSSSFRQLVASHLFGGIHVKSGDDQKRATYLSENQLQLGDIVLYVEGTGEESVESAWIYLGDQLLATLTEQGIQIQNAEDILPTILAKNKFVFLRPTLEHKNRELTEEAEKRIGSLSEEELSIIEQEVGKYQKPDKETFGNRLSQAAYQFYRNQNVQYNAEPSSYQELPEKMEKMNEISFIDSVYYHSFGIHLPTKKDELLQAEEMKVQEKDFSKLTVNDLARGDILMYQYQNQSGSTEERILLYLGNSRIITYTKEQGLFTERVSLYLSELKDAKNTITEYALLRPAKQYRLQNSMIQLGDTNQDDIIDLRDLSTLVLHLSEEMNYQLTGLKKKAADLNQDGEIDLRDLSIMLSNFNQAFN